MSIIKRLSTSLFASVDQMVGEIENHDALIKAAITEQKRKIAAARIQLNKIKSSEEKVTQQIEVLKCNDQRWTERAVTEASNNEAQALTCLQRRKAIREQIEKLTTARNSYQQTSIKMSGDINRCEQELKTMSQKHELLRARQTSSDALNVINEVSGSNIDNLETSFERWEIKIAQGEFNIDDYDTPDQIEQEYISQENEQQLRDELAELMNTENRDDNA